MSAFPLAILVPVVLFAQTVPSGTAEQFAARVQQRFDTVKDFEADFVQSYEGGLLRTKTTERGTVAVKRPGRMRWVYTRPEKKEFVSDGSRVYSYVPADKQVVVSPFPNDATTPTLFLTGKGNLVRDFTASFTDLPGGAPGLKGLKLVPKKADASLDWVILGINSATLQIRQLITADRQGGRSSFTFSNLKENRGLSDKIFEFRIPRGVDVVTSGMPSK